MIAACIYVYKLPLPFYRYASAFFNFLKFLDKFVWDVYLSYVEFLLAVYYFQTPSFFLYSRKLQNSFTGNIDITRIE